MFNFARARRAAFERGRVDRGRRLYGRDRAAIRPASPMRWRRSAPPSPSARWSFCGNSRRAHRLFRRRPGRRGRRRARHRPHAAQFARRSLLPLRLSARRLRPRRSRAQQRRAALAECLAAARPLIDVLWLARAEGAAIDTPERRAAFEARLRSLLAQIANARVARSLSPRGEEPAVRALARAGRRRRQAPAGAGGTRSRGWQRADAAALVSRLRHRHDPRAGQSPLAARPLRRGGRSRRDQGQGARALLQTVSRTIFEHANVTREQLMERLAPAITASCSRRLSQESAFKRVAFLQPETSRGRGRGAVRRPHLSLPRAAQPQSRDSGRRRSPRRGERGRVRAIRRASAASCQRRQPARRRRCRRSRRIGALSRDRGPAEAGNPRARPPPREARLAGARRHGIALDADVTKPAEPLRLTKADTTRLCPPVKIPICRNASYNLKIASHQPLMREGANQSCAHGISQKAAAQSFDGLRATA